AGDLFGWSVAISGDSAIVGAFLKGAGGSFAFRRSSPSSGSPPRSD
ncbi:MAG: hypothetical protein IIA54_08220, partial [Chloroflexi bacterium]|nr:hypothetical protein [Chloroflexota bacterium]